MTPPPNLTPTARNPAWSRDELILALDLYMTNPASPPGKGSKAVADLSKTLNDIGTLPLHTLPEEKKTKLDDLALVCANCHRMIHARKQWLSVEALKVLIKKTG